MHQHAINSKSQRDMTVMACSAGSGSLEVQLLQRERGRARPLKNGKALDTTLGFTPLDGMAMATRSGRLDPNIVIHLLEHEGFTTQRISG
ncbi:MAG TPA: hypothetical protein VIC26_05015 [Marinagarivorans sp.]